MVKLMPLDKLTPLISIMVVAVRISALPLCLPFCLKASYHGELKVGTTYSCCVTQVQTIYLQHWQLNALCITVLQAYITPWNIQSYNEHPVLLGKLGLLFFLLQSPSIRTRLIIHSLHSPSRQQKQLCFPCLRSCYKAEST